MGKYNHYNYPFHRISFDMPYISGRQMAIINNILRTKEVVERCKRLEDRGFVIKRCYIPNYNGIGGMTYMPRLNEIRIIVGRPKEHEPREVYAIIVKPKSLVINSLQSCSETLRND